MVARSDAHDSGLCVLDDATLRAFARDLLSLTLAAPGVNRHQKSDRDAAEWLPQRNRCWFAARVVEVRRKYGLTIDRREADALDAVLAGCSSTNLVFHRGSPGPAGAGRHFGEILRRRTCPVGRQRERSHHVRRSAASRHRTDAPWATRRTRSCGTATGRLRAELSSRLRSPEGALAVWPDPQRLPACVLRTTIPP